MGRGLLLPGARTLEQVSTVPPPPRRGVPLRDRVAITDRPVAARRPHCLVTDPQGQEWPGLVITWRRDHDGSWSAWTVYVVDEEPDPVLVQAWTPATALRAV